MGKIEESRRELLTHKEIMKDIKIKEAVEARVELIEDINQALNKFFNKTGTMPARVDCEFRAMDRIGERANAYLLQSIDVTIDI